MDASCQREARHVDRGLQDDLDEDEVTKIHIGLPGRERVLTHLGQGDHHLQPYPGMILRQTLLQGGEAELAGIADEYHASGHADDVSRLLPHRQVVPLLANRGERVSARNGNRIGFTPLGQQPCPLVQPNLHLLGQPGIVAVARHPVSLGDRAGPTR